MSTGKQKVIRVLVIIFAVTIIGLGVGIFLGYRYIEKLSKTLPDVARLEEYQPLVPSTIYARDGEVIGEIFKERRYLVEYKDISPILVKAFLAAEDARFFEHKGVDVMGTLRAALRYVGTISEVKQGGSTITQQLVKNILLTREKTFDRKFKDIMLAMRIEKVMTKEKILELYLNTLFLGNNSYGVEAAARNYFRKGNKDLTLAEAALIAGLAPAPSAFAPTEDFRKAKVRQRFVLERMAFHKWITPEEQAEALKTTLKVFRAQAPNTQVAPYFFMEVKKQLEQLIGSHALSTDGYKIYTTLDLEVQKKAQQAIVDALKNHQDKIGFRGPLKRHGESYSDSLRDLIASPLENETTEKAIVVDLLPSLDAALIVAQSGFGILLSEDHRWALKSAKKDSKLNGEFADILRVGDEVRVGKKIRITPTRFNTSVLGKLAASLKKHVVLFQEGQSLNQLNFFMLQDTIGIEAAALIMDAKQGDVLAMVGGSNFEGSQFNRATQAQRQVGSSVKPLYYGYAMDMGFSPASLLSTEPIVIGDWKPENYDKKFLGTTTLRRSLLFSHNIPSVHLFQALSPQKVNVQMHKLGLNWPNGDLSVALGSGNATLLQMTQAYSIFANNGKVTPASYITKIVDKAGKEIVKRGDHKLFAHPLPSNKPEDMQIISPEAAFVMVKTMQDVIRAGTGSGAMGVSPDAAGKTGTTNGYTDAWFLGVVPGLVSGVWVGFDDARKSLGADGTGGKISAPLWREVLKNAVQKYQSKTTWEPPSRISYINVDPETGKMVTGGKGIRLAVVTGTEPGSPGAQDAIGYIEDRTSKAKTGEPGKAVEKEAPAAPALPTIEETDSLRGLE